MRSLLALVICLIATLASSAGLGQHKRWIKRWNPHQGKRNGRRFNQRAIAKPRQLRQPPSFRGVLGAAFLDQPPPPPPPAFDEIPPPPPPQVLFEQSQAVYEEPAVEGEVPVEETVAEPAPVIDYAARQREREEKTMAFIEQLNDDLATRRAEQEAREIADDVDNIMQAMDTQMVIEDDKKMLEYEHAVADSAIQQMAIDNIRAEMAQNAEQAFMEFALA